MRNVSNQTELYSLRERATRWAWAQNLATSTERLVLLAVAKNVENWQLGMTCRRSAAGLSSDTGFSTRTVKKTLKSLADKDYIVVYKRASDDGSNLCNDYILNTQAYRLEDV